VLSLDELASPPGWFIETLPGFLLDMRPVQWYRLSQLEKTVSHDVRLVSQ